MSPPPYPGAALITGASSGIGEAFARHLSARGMPLILVARRAERLHALAAELGVPCAVVAQDLAQPGGCAAVEAAVWAAGLQVGVVVHSAGFGRIGRFEALTLDEQLEMVDLNCRAAVELTRRFLPDMLAAGRGALIFVSSLGAFQGAPLMSVYGASKAFDLGLAEGLYHELRGRGVDVLGLCPGPVRTRFGVRAGVEVFRGEATYLAPERVAEAAMAALGRRPVKVLGFFPWLAVFLGRFFPRWVAAWVSGRVARSLRPSIE